jgi:hypothetical protein
MQSSDSNSSGIIYIAFGSKFIDEAVNSARTAKMFSPQIQITLFADFNPQDECFDKFIPISPGHKRCKVDYIDQTPYRDTIYLDTDTNQPSFRVALWNSDLRIHTLPPEFNVRSLSQQRRVHRRRKNPTTPEVLHPRILHWRGVGRRKILFFTRHYRASKY